MIFVLAGGVILQWRYNHELRGELMALRNELARTREESAQLKQAGSNTTAEAQSSVDQRELLRLRNWGGNCDRVPPMCGNPPTQRLKSKKKLNIPS